MFHAGLVHCQKTSHNFDACRAGLEALQSHLVHPPRIQTRDPLFFEGLLVVRCFKNREVADSCLVASAMRRNMYFGLGFQNVNAEKPLKTSPLHFSHSRSHFSNPSINHHKSNSLVAINQFILNPSIGRLPAHLSHIFCACWWPRPKLYYDMLHNCQLVA